MCTKFVILLEEMIKGNLKYRADFKNRVSFNPAHPKMKTANSSIRRFIYKYSVDLNLYFSLIHNFCLNLYRLIMDKF